MQVLVTGASGFVGAGLKAAFAGVACELRTPGREDIGDLGAKTDWRTALDGVDAVIHLAGPAHARFRERDLKRAIIDGTDALVRQARAAGVSRFIFLSSIKAVADDSASPLDEDVEPRPRDAYGRAKRAAELCVLDAGAMRPVVLRPPLIHGPKARANVARLLALADLPAPLPLAGLRARRNVIALDRVGGAIVSVLASPEGRPGIYHLADQPALTIGEMIGALRQGLGRSPGLFALPGVGAFAPRAARTSLVIDDARFRAEYGYGDAVGMDSGEALAATAAAWKGRR